MLKDGQTNLTTEPHDSSFHDIQVDNNEDIASLNSTTSVETLQQSSETNATCNKNESSPFLQTAAYLLDVYAIKVSL